LSRYTHRIAISNRRLLSADQSGVTFKYKDYRIDGPARYKTMTLATNEFIRRFLIHVLPKGFHRIRHTVEAVRQDVDEEAADELVCCERHPLVAGAAGGTIILVPEGDADIVERDEPAVGDGDGIRHYGLFANGNRGANIARARELLAV
jgi:Putative transposase